MSVLQSRHPVFFLFQYPLIILFVLLISGCYRPMKNYGELYTADMCLPLYQNAAMSPLKGKIPIMPSDIPTQEMIMQSAPASQEEIQAIKVLEEADRTCKQMREKKGSQTSATEDIYTMRISKLRYGLFNGEIPYAVYNYGIVKAMQDQMGFAQQGKAAFMKGQEVGARKAAAFNAHLSNIQNQYNSYNFNSNRTWNCTASPITDYTARVSCY